MKIALLTTDNRELDRAYAETAPRFGAAPEALLQGLATVPELEAHVISCTQQTMQSPEKLADNIWFHSLHVPKVGWMRTLYQGCVRAVRRKLRDLQPDIVHGQGTERDCAVSAVFSGLPNVLTIHGNMRAVAKFFEARPGSFYWLAARLETLSLRRTAGVFCNSAYTENLVAPAARKTWRVPNALRRPFFETPPSALPNHLPVLLNVGVLSPYKRQGEILDMARRLWQRGFRLELQFAGLVETKDRYGADFVQRLAEAEKTGYARHLGNLPTDKLMATMDSASALVHASAEESFGLVVAEALARNLKLFASATGGVVDIASGVEGAQLFPASDWLGLENAIARWLETGCPRPTTAAKAMRQRYHPEVIARRHMEIYCEVLSAA